MAMIKFELTEEHLALLKQLNWDYDKFRKKGEVYHMPDKDAVVKLMENETFGNGHIYEMMGIILNGPDEVNDPNNTIDFGLGPVEPILNRRFDVKDRPTVKLGRVHLTNLILGSVFTAIDCGED